MKTSVLKMMLPVVAFTLASAGAIGTATTTEKAASASLEGYRPVADQDEPCEFVKMCSDTGTTFCTIDGTPQTARLWHRTNVNLPCNIAVYEP